jgi:hypothetical protein
MAKCAGVLLEPWELSFVGCRRADMLLRNPITGIAGRCARAATAHAAALPSPTMNSRRLIRITSSASRLRNDSGIVSPMAFAVLRLTTNSYLVGNCRGSSLTLTPRSRRSI